MPKAPSTRSGYGALLRVPGVGFLLATSLAARLPVAMVNLAIILRIVRVDGSYARAGGVTAAFVLGTGVMGPVLGRLADRFGRRPVLLIASAGNAAGLVLLALVPVADFPQMVAVAAATGCSLPPVAPSVRSLWRQLVDEPMQPSLYAMDATLQELTFIAGPSLVAGISTLASPSFALIFCAFIGLGGSIAVCSHPATARPMPESAKIRSPRTPVASSGLVALVAIVFMFLASIVTVEIGVVAFAGLHHASGQAGLLLAVWSGGSLTGGIFFGARIAGAGARGLAPVMMASASGFFLITAASGVAVLYGLLFLAGVAIAPGFSCIYGLAGAITPPSGAVEAFSWIASGIQIGAATGAALGGVLVQGCGPRWTFVCAGGAATATAAVALWQTRHLAAAERVARA